jgi:hypothetical protein
MQSEYDSFAYTTVPAVVIKGDESQNQYVAGDNKLPFEVSLSFGDKSFKIISEKSTATASEDEE